MTEYTTDALITQVLQIEKKEGIGPAIAKLREAGKQHPNDQKIMFHTAGLLEKSKQFLAALGLYHAGTLGCVLLDEIVDSEAVALQESRPKGLAMVGEDD